MFCVNLSDHEPNKVMSVDVVRLSNLLGCTEGDVRLSDGSGAHEGRVEICKDSAWGTVCDTGWGKADATVVCRQLNYSVAGKISVQKK